MSTFRFPENAGIGLVAPGEWVTEKAIRPAAQLLESLGYRVFFAPHLFGKHRYFSGTVEERLSDIHYFLQKEEVQIIYAARGGVGSAQLLPHLDFAAWQQTRKLLVGFSDVTALQWGLWARTGLPSISGMTLTLQLHAENPYLTLFREMLTGERYSIGEADLVKSGARVVRPGEAEGILLGGALTIINSLLGTPFFPELNQPIILFLEDVKEPLYRLERLLVQLQQAGVLEKVVALILGRFLWQDTWHELWPVFQYLFPPNIPVITHFPYGHFADACPLPMGVFANLSTEPLKLVWK